MTLRTVRDVVMILLVLAHAGCAGAAKYEAMAVERDAGIRAAADVAAQARAAEAAAPQAPQVPGGADRPAAPPAAAQQAAQQRIIIYSGLVHLVVSDIAQAIETIRAQAVAMGGYLHEMDASSITVRVPAARFHEAVASFSRLGVVTSRQVKAQDVTEELRDLRIRLENALQTRARLLAHLEKSAKTEDTLKIEAELDRVTQTIELLKGKLQALESHVAYSVLKVQLNSPVPQQNQGGAGQAVPFPWVRKLGEAAISGASAPNADTSRRERRAIRFDPPPSYIRFFDRDDVSETMSAEGVVLRIQKQKNYPGGDVAFWSALARRTLVETRSIAFEGDGQDVASGDKAPGRLMVGTRDLAGQKSGYLLALFVTEDGVYAAEAWGPVAAFAKDREALVKAVGSIEAKR